VLIKRGKLRQILNEGVSFALPYAETNFQYIYIYRLYNVPLQQMRKKHHPTVHQLVMHAVGMGRYTSNMTG